MLIFFFHFLVLQEYWVLTESRIPLKQVLRGVRIFALSKRTGSIKPSLLFSYIVGYLYFWRIRFSRLFWGHNSCRCFCVELVKHLPVHRYSVNIFHILVLQEYWVLTETRIPLKTVLVAWDLLHFPLILMNRLNKTASPVFLYSRFSICGGSVFPYYFCTPRAFSNACQIVKNAK